MQENSSNGSLQIQVINIQTNFPVSGASISISFTGDPQSTIEQLSTNQSGQTEPVDLSAPPIDYSLSPGINQPYSEYNLTITAPGYQPLEIAGTEILADTLAIQPAAMEPLPENSTQPPISDTSGNETPDVVTIPEHTLYGNYPPKIVEAEIKPVNESGEIVLSRVVVPETIVVHDGPPSDRSARDYYVPYRDYIKNVASSEIYATWPANSITANVLAIMSFTLNRVYTEW